MNASRASKIRRIETPPTTQPPDRPLARCSRSTASKADPGSRASTSPRPNPSCALTMRLLPGIWVRPRYQLACRASWHSRIEREDVLDARSRPISEKRASILTSLLGPRNYFVACHGAPALFATSLRAVCNVDSSSFMKILRLLMIGSCEPLSDDESRGPRQESDNRTLPIWVLLIEPRATLSEIRAPVASGRPSGPGR